jgi:hypothetical protein
MSSEEQLVDFLSHSTYSYFDILNDSVNDPVVLLQLESCMLLVESFCAQHNSGFVYG